ncbi:ribose transport system substrate-binding protein [Evansella caseinilytica]|uniref:Ribose transport system substrate-binding protein n=1 Tax=Evansella caseinilytica TaxID=1503961 RepID=A0A1H3IV31_9BACI|nr:substrate-binding domain-containing protein [Evansella caseinilytica]SDY31616.1 ribose transport system substrate-binding protein [Evansella caseinilytica]
MKKLMIVYMLLIGTFVLYVYNTHLRDSPANAWNAQGLQGEITETYVMVTFQSGMDFWKSSLKGFEDAAQLLNVSVEYRGATQYDVQEQVTVLEQVIAKNPAGIAITAINSPEIADTINKAVDGGIPVVLFDSQVPGSKASAFVSTNNYNAGVTAAHEMARLLDQAGEVAVVTLENQLNHQERTAGFADTIRGSYPDIRVVTVVDGKGDRLASKEAAGEIMANYPDVSGIFVTEANGGVGIGEAIRLEKKIGDVQVISFDTDKRTLDMIEEGIISASIAQGAWNMGYWSLHFLFHLQHDLTEQQIMESPGISTLPQYVDTGVTVVTKANVKNYYAQ